MICLFEKTATDFSGNGICVLEPSVCVVSEIAGGSYDLRMEHPMDTSGKYLLITDERIIKAPVPPVHISKITLPSVVKWVTNNSADLYSVLPAYRRIPCAADIKAAKQNPSSYAWRNGLVYMTGMLVTSGGNIYRAKSENYSTPVTNTTVWKYETTVAGSGDTYIQDGGTIIETLASGSDAYKIADYDATYMQVRSEAGNVGYILRSLCDETTTTESGQEIPAQDIDEQPFRIDRIECEDDTGKIIVHARHISYDFKGNALYSCEIKDAEPMTAISRLRGSLLDADDRIIACDIEGQRITKDWSFLNPVNALLDPDVGLVSILGAQLIRNNQDFFILSNESPKQGIRIAYGSNMKGVRWKRSTENVITRVLPRCDDGNGGYLYLESVYVESSKSTSYAFQRTEPMNCEYVVGQEYEKADGTTDTWTEASAREQMRLDAQARFDIDKVDEVEIELEVDFLLLGDTEEYAQYRGLQRVNLYDIITVETGPSNVTATAQASEYEYDSILKRYNYIKLGSIKSFKSRIPGYRVKANSITYAKLSQDVINRIKGSREG